MNRRPKNSDAHKVERAHSTLSVSAVDYYLSLPVTSPPSPAISTVTLTPGRIRNIDQDMEALRASRQDNPFIKQVIASRESLIDSLDDEASDHANLMSKEMSLDLDVDPVTLPEMHEHMIRSPPPTMWPKSPNFRAFNFPNNDDETLQVEVTRSSDISPLKSLGGRNHHHHQDVFSLLTPGSLRSGGGDDNIHLMDSDE